VSARSRLQKIAARRTHGGADDASAQREPDAAPPTPRTLDELGVAASLPQSSSGGDYLSVIESAIGTAPVADLVIVNPPRPVRTGDAYAARYPDARIHVLTFTSPPAVRPGRFHPNLILRECDGIDEVHSYLNTITPPQVLIDSCTGPHRKLAALYELVFHLQDGGLYVIERLHEMADVAVRTKTSNDVVRGLARLLVIKANPAPRVTKRITAHDIARARALDEVDWRRDIILIRKRGRHLPKLRDSEADAVLTARRGSSWGHTITRLPAQVFESRATARSNDPEREFSPRLKVPELYLREYHDVICAPRQLAIQGGDLVLPISFHHRLHPHLVNRSNCQRDDSEWFLSTEGLLNSAPHLSGAYYHLDNEFPWHFGHFMTEDISRLWGWHEAKRRHPDLKILISTWDTKKHIPGTGPTYHQLTVLGAYGIPADDIVCIDAPVTVDVLIGASQMLYNPRHISPFLAETWDRLRAGLRTTEPQQAPTRRLFVTRDPALNRSCRNAGVVEQVFETHGYEIVRPEQFDIPTQVDMFTGADVVAGFGGSGMFNTIYCDRPGKRIVIAPYSYSARNEYLISALRGDDYRHFFCPSDIDHPVGTWSRKAFFASFAFDFDRDGAALEQALQD
jgi:capsular polysaccharide biosynthesis protein